MLNNNPPPPAYRERGKARPSERQQAIERLWLRENVSLAQAERAVDHWQFQRWLRESGRVTK